MRFKWISALGLIMATSAVSAASEGAPPAPDYRRAENWSAGPGGAGPAAALPQGATPAQKRPKVDVFFIHPTTYPGNPAHNQDVADAQANAWADASSIARQASLFSGCCRIFAPRYRQASIAALRGTAEQREAAYDLAYTDIERAFDYFIRHHNKGRPFILAGHSQGGLHVSRLLERRIDGTPLGRRMVAAYTAGMNIIEGEFGLRYKQVKPCGTPTDTGCVLQWNAVLPEVDVAAMAKQAKAAFVAKYGEDAPGQQGLCINPISFDRARPEVLRGEARGAVPGDPGAGPMLPLMAGAVSAKCVQGYLVVEPDPALALKPLPGGSMHYHDYGLFWADVRADAIRRSESFQKRRK